MSLKPFPADPAFPQLKIATDPELMREVLRMRLSVIIPCRNSAAQLPRLAILRSAVW